MDFKVSAVRTHRRSVSDRQSIKKWLARCKLFYQWLLSHVRLIFNPKHYIWLNRARGQRRTPHDLLQEAKAVHDLVDTVVGILPSVNLNALRPALQPFKQSLQGKSVGARNKKNVYKEKQYVLAHQENEEGYIITWWKKTNFHVEFHSVLVLTNMDKPCELLNIALTVWEHINLTM